MVLVDGVKYACQQCIKGHRSSKCTHSTRPLVEIRKKGRPSTQCSHCKDLRKTKAVHARCDCAARDDKQDHVARVLPNGIADVVKSPDPEGADLTRTEPSGVTLLLNPCNCLRGGKCTCCESNKKPAPKFFPAETPVVGSSSTSSQGSKLSCCAPQETPSPPSTGIQYDPTGDIVVSPDPTAGSPVASTSSLLPTTPINASLSAVPMRSTPSTESDPRAGLPSHFATLSTTHSWPAPSSSGPASPALLPTPPLFLPPTAGTLACFCGPTCQCVGCATHDPYSRKRPAPGACSGGGCHCGTGKGCEEGKIASKKSRVEAGPTSTSKGGCCGSKKPAAVEPSSCCGSKRTSPNDSISSLLDGPPAGSAGVSLPSLWSPAAQTLSAEVLDPLPVSLSSPPPAGPPMSAPLPSLRTLWPALLDVDASFLTPDGGQPPSSVSVDLELLNGEHSDHGVLDGLPVGLFNPSREPAILRSSTRAGETMANGSSGLDGRSNPPFVRNDKLVLTACSACFLEEPLDDVCGPDEDSDDESEGGDENDGHGGRDEADVQQAGCQCTSACACRQIAKERRRSRELGANVMTGLGSGLTG